MNEHNFIFLGGLHRSGTWLQTHCLEEHPQVSRLGTVSNQGADRGVEKLEGQFLQTVYPSDEYYGGVGRLGFHPDVHLTENSPLVTQENRAKLFREWSRFWDTGKPYLLEKTPANLVRSRFLQAMFPTSYFVFIMRNPVAVALAQQKWSGTSVSSLIEHWLACYEMLREDLNHIRNYIFLRYEDFIQGPEDKLKQVYAFLNLEPRACSQTIRSDGNEPYLRVWEKNMTAETGRRTFSRRILNRFMLYAARQGYPVTVLRNEIPSMVHRYESRINTFGYSLKKPREYHETDFAMYSKSTR